MTITKTRNTKLFMLASLACGQKDSRSATSMVKQHIPAIAPVSDISDDDTSTVESASPAKEILVVRRRRRPLKKRIPMDDYRPSSSSLLYLNAPIKPRKSLLETSIEIVSNNKYSSRRLKTNVPARIESRDEEILRDVPEPRNDSDDDSHSPQAADDEEMPSLVSDDAAWKNVHSPLDLPNFLPCPAMALKYVESICLTIEER